MLNQMTAEMREQFAAFVELRKAAETAAAQGGDEAAGKLARADLKPRSMPWGYRGTRKRSTSCSASWRATGSWRPKAAKRRKVMRGEGAASADHRGAGRREGRADR